MKCDHTIGIYYDYDDTCLYSIEMLKNHLKAIKERNLFIKNSGYILRDLGYKKEYTLKTYYKRLKEDDDFDLFNYCPDCGKSIKEIEKDLFKEEI